MKGVAEVLLMPVFIGTTLKADYDKICCPKIDRSNASEIHDRIQKLFKPFIKKNDIDVTSMQIFYSIEDYFERDISNGLFDYATQAIGSVYKQTKAFLPVGGMFIHSSTGDFNLPKLISPKFKKIDINPPAFYISFFLLPIIVTSKDEKVLDAFLDDYFDCDIDSIDDDIEDISVQIEKALQLDKGHTELFIFDPIMDDVEEMLGIVADFTEMINNKTASLN